MGMQFPHNKVLVWRTVDTAFDYSHGVDMYFEIVDGSDPNHIKYAKIDVDLSVNPKIFVPPGFTNLDRSHFLGENLAGTAVMIGKKLVAKLNGENRERGGVHSSDNGFRKI